MTGIALVIGVFGGAGLRLDARRPVRRSAGCLFLRLLQHRRPRHAGSPRSLDRAALHHRKRVPVLACGQSALEADRGPLLRSSSGFSCCCSRFCQCWLRFPFTLPGLQHLEPTRAIVVSCLEPVFSIVIAAIASGRNHASASGRRNRFGTWPRSSWCSCRTDGRRNRSLWSSLSSKTGFAEGLSGPPLVVGERSV